MSENKDIESECVEISHFDTDPSSEKSWTSDSRDDSLFNDSSQSQFDSSGDPIYHSETTSSATDNKSLYLEESDEGKP